MNRETAAKGPLVWLDMDQKELDDAYNQLAYAPNRDQILGRFATNSEIARKHLGQPERFAYGESAAEKLDVFRTRKDHAPIIVFVHGGAWRSGEAKNYAFIAQTFVNAGVHFVALDFANVGETGGDLLPMAEQVRRGIVWVYRNAAKIGGDPERMYLTGQSSGAHLAACALVDQKVVKAALLSSGMYDLKPVRLSARNGYVKFTDEVEEKLSPQRHLERISCPVTVVYGSLDTPEFQRQARDFASALGKANKDVNLVVAEGYNHFELTESMGNPYGVLGRAALRMTGAAGT